MYRASASLLLACFLAPLAPAAAPPRPLPDGVYAVLRDDPSRDKVLPLRAGETVAVHRHRFLKQADQHPPLYLVVRTTPDVLLELDGAAKPIKDGDKVVGLHLKLRTKAAAALERLTRDRVGGQVVIVIGGEVVNMLKVRSPIKGGQVQITSCAPKQAGYLLERLQANKPAR